LLVCCYPSGGQAGRFAATAIKLANFCYCSTSFPQQRQPLLLALEFPVSADNKKDGNVNQINANSYLLQMQINYFFSIILPILCCLLLAELKAKLC
jgi:hypothetical protein